MELISEQSSLSWEGIGRGFPQNSPQPTSLGCRVRALLPRPQPWLSGLCPPAPPPGLTVCTLYGPLCPGAQGLGTDGMHGWWPVLAEEVLLLRYPSFSPGAVLVQLNRWEGGPSSYSKTLSYAFLKVS